MTKCTGDFLDLRLHLAMQRFGFQHAIQVDLQQAFVRMGGSRHVGLLSDQGFFSFAKGRCGP